MNIDLIEKKFNFEDIFAYLDKRKHLVNKLHSLQEREEKLRNNFKELDKAFFDCTVDAEKYLRFFKKYYISMYNDTQKYILDNIHLTKDSDGKDFYEVNYTFINTESRGYHSHSGKVSLRKFIHLLDNVGVLKEFEG